MDGQFDNHLGNHIREVFDNFEDPAADAGWQLLREKFPARKKDRGIIWLWFGTAAAVLLLALGIGTWIFLKKYDTAKFFYKPEKTYRDKNKPVDEVQRPVKKQAAASGAYNNKTGIAANTSRRNLTPIAIPKLAPIKPANKNIAPGSTPNNSPAESLIVDNKATASNKPIVIKPEESAVVAHDSAINKNSIAVIPKSVSKPANPFLTNKDNSSTEHEQNETAQKSSPAKPVQYSVYAATFFNYAKGSDTKLNIGVGVTADIRLTENLKLSTGVAITQNTLNFDDQSIQASIPAFLSTAFAYGGANANNVLASSNNNYNAQLVALDIPTNLKYEFDPQKNSNYILVGLSSGAFISETYTYQYNTPNVYYSQQPLTKTTTNGFGNFYFAKTLNFSVGMGYPLSKTNRLIIEPFLKYPLDGLGSQQIRFGAGGVNLKFDFQSSKK